MPTTLAKLRLTHAPLSKVVGYDSFGSWRRDYTGQYNLARTTQEIYAPTKPLDYKQNANKYLSAMPKARLEAGRLYAALKMKQSAHKMFCLVMKEVGKDSSVGTVAAEELSKLTVPM